MYSKQPKIVVISEIIFPLIVLFCLGAFPFFTSTIITVSSDPLVEINWGKPVLILYVLPYFITELLLLNGAMYLHQGVEQMNFHICNDWLKCNKVSSALCFLGNAIALRLFYCKGLLLVSLNIVQLVRFVIRGWSLHIIHTLCKRLKKRDYCTFTCDILHV